MDETNWIKISFDRIECSSLSRSAYCASPLCVYVCVCVFFLHHLIKLVNTSQRIQQRRFTINSACKRKIARFVPRYSVVVAVIVVVIVITVVVDVCSQLAVRFRPSTADKRGVAFERNCESCIASRNRKRKGKFSRKGHIHRMYEQIQRGGVPSESYRPHAQWSVKKSLTRISPSSLSLSLIAYPFYSRIHLRDT